jgi:hypothetical protein
MCGTDVNILPDSQFYLTRRGPGKTWLLRCANEFDDTREAERFLVEVGDALNAARGLVAVKEATDEELLAEAEELWEKKLNDDALPSQPGLYQQGYIAGARRSR